MTSRPFVKKQGNSPGKDKNLLYLSQLTAMKKLTLELTPEELSALTDMASNQLFRKQFIDPKMPGFVQNHEELGICKNLVGRLRSAMDTQRGKVSSAEPVARAKKAVAR